MHSPDKIFNRTRILLGCSVAALTLLALAAPAANASKTQWSMFEDQRSIVQSGPTVRTQTLDDIQALGADTLRININWGNIAPDSNSKTRPAFDATNPSAYPGFAPFDNAIVDANARGFRIMLTIAGPIPVWATAGGRGNNRAPDANEFAQFVTAVGQRYSGGFNGLPRITNWSFMNEPNHPKFLGPQKVHASPAARYYRAMIEKGVPALRATGHQGDNVLVGELAPNAATGSPGPLGFMRSWLCLDKNYKRLKGRAAKREGCSGSFKKVDANGFAIHAYTRPISNYKPKGDQITIAVIRRLATALDKAARAGRLPRGLPIYNTEFGIQTNPPDPYQGGSLASQSRILNESEDISYRYSRLRSYSQYLLYDDPKETSGPSFDRFRGFQSGLRFTDGRAKPAYEAYKFPIVVHKRGSGVLIWGRVRPGTGTRYVQIQRRQGGSYQNLGGRIATNSAGYFTVPESLRGLFRFQAVDANGNAYGSSRVTGPVK